MNKVLLTGSTGFIGASIAKRLRLGYSITAPVRKAPVLKDPRITYHVFSDIMSVGDNKDIFADCDTVIHAAAKAHVNGKHLGEFKQTNTTATLKLAKMAAKCGVRRFIYLSSIGVNGVANTKPFTIKDSPAPIEDYAISKLEAENGLKQLANEVDMDIVIVRPPLVYGPNAPGNFGKLLSLVKKHLPLPLGAIDNKRSLVAIDNLVDFVVTCIEHPKAANETFLVSDDTDISTTELLRLMTEAAGHTPRLIPVPMSWLKLAGKITGKQSIIDRLCSSLQVDISHTKQVLGWTPPITVEEGIAKCFKAKSNEP